VIRLEDVRKCYPGAEAEVLRGVDLQINRRDFVSLVGRSGSGKTTLLNLIGGLDRAFEGTISVDGTDLQTLGEPQISAYRNRRVGHIFQAYHLLDHLSCRENVGLAALFARGEARKDPVRVRRRADEALALVGLADFGGRGPTTLSGGERQRVAVARAIFQRPEILLCDEPTGNLDTETGRDLVRLLRTLHERDEITVIAATHDEAIASGGGRVFRLIDGVLVEDPETGR